MVNRGCLRLASHVLALALCAGPARAETYSYRDANGRLHVVGSLTDVPPSYRPGARAAGGGPAGAVPGGTGAASVPAGAAASSPSAGGSAPPVLPAVPAAASGPPRCDVGYDGVPEIRAVGRKPQVTFSGTLVNRGPGTARNVWVTAEVHSAFDGSLLDTETLQLRPNDLAPGAAGRYEITLDYGKLGQRHPGQDKIQIAVGRCEAPSGPPPTAAPSCGLALEGRAKFDVDDRAGKVTVSGSAVNRGPGVARGVEVSVSTFDQRTWAPIDTYRASTVPGTLAAGASGRFSLTMPQELGHRAPDRDRVELRSTRCDLATPAR